MEQKENFKKIVLAYSGGLDTSIIIPWLKENYGNPEIVAVSADVGQESELEGLEEKALKTGASKLYIEDLKKEFIEDYIYPTVQAGAKYEDKYLLGTSFARPVIAKRLVEIAKKEGADAICHGCTPPEDFCQELFDISALLQKVIFFHTKKPARPEGPAGLCYYKYSRCRVRPLPPARRALSRCPFPSAAFCAPQSRPE